MPLEGSDGIELSDERRRMICPQWKSAEGLSSMHFLCWRLISQYGFGAARVAGALRLVVLQSSSTEFGADEGRDECSVCHL